jgi:hypothetical protein
METMNSLRLMCYAFTRLGLFLFVLGCARQKTEIVYHEPIIYRSITRYIQELSSPPDHVVTVSLHEKGDTVEIVIANAYPLSPKPIAHDLIRGFDVFFTGQPRADYYEATPFNQESAAPTLRKKVNATYGDRPIPPFNYPVLRLSFVNHKLVQEAND